MQGQVSFVLLTLIAMTFGVAYAPQAVSMTSLSQETISFSTTRSQAYYLAAIPAPHGANLLSFDWNVSVTGASNGTGSVQFSHNNSTWSNLASFELAAGGAEGRQGIDSSWAAPGANYLRAAFNRSLSHVLNLEVVVNYDMNLLVILSPFLVGAVLGSAIYFRRKGREQSTTPTQ